MTQLATDPARTLEAAKLEQKIRDRIETLSYLPTTVAVAMRFIDLGKNIEAEPADYARVIESDSSLSSKLLAMANSPWFGIRNKVTSVKLAVNLLGLGTVRTLAISYCMAGLHNELKLTADESRMFWEAALCKATAARAFAKARDAKRADEAFLMGMFQDFALPIMYASAKDALLSLIQDPLTDVRAKLQKERELFRLDHTEVGRVLAQKLELPDVFVDAIAFHHDRERLDGFMQHQIIAHAVYAASLFPPLLNVWNNRDADALCQFLDQHGPAGSGHSAAFLEAVQMDFNEMYRYFEENNSAETRLAELMIQAAREDADGTAHLVRTVNELMQEAAGMGIEMSQLLQRQTTLEDKATRDPLTGLLNRDGFSRQAEPLLAKATRYGVGLAVVYMDIDKFKSINDTLGHDFGDRALKSVANHMVETVRQHDVLGRIGGDEFVVILYDLKQAEAEDVVRRLLDRVAAEPVSRSGRATTATLSAGLLYLPPGAPAPPSLTR